MPQLTVTKHRPVTVQVPEGYVSVVTVQGGQAYFSWGPLMPGAVSGDVAVHNAGSVVTLVGVGSFLAVDGDVTLEVDYQEAPGPGGDTGGGDGGGGGAFGFVYNDQPGVAAGGTTDIEFFVGDRFDALAVQMAYAVLVRCGTLNTHLTGMVTTITADTVTVRLRNAGTAAANGTIIAWLTATPIA